MHKKSPMDHDIRVWLSSEMYLAAERAAIDDDRTLSGYVRALIRRDLDERVLAARATARDDEGPARVASGRSGA